MSPSIPCRRGRRSARTAKLSNACTSSATCLTFARAATIEEANIVLIRYLAVPRRADGRLWVGRTVMLEERLDGSLWVGTDGANQRLTEAPPVAPLLRAQKLGRIEPVAGIEERPAGIPAPGPATTRMSSSPPTTLGGGTCRQATVTKALAAWRSESLSLDTQIKSDSRRSESTLLVPGHEPDRVVWTASCYDETGQTRLASAPPCVDQRGVDRRHGSVG